MFVPFIEPTADSLRRKDKIQWECDNGGQLWTDSVDAGYETSASFPSGFCASGFSSLNAAFIVGLVIDLVFQVRIRSRLCYRGARTDEGWHARSCDTDVHVLHGVALPEEARALLGHERAVLWR